MTKLIAVVTAGLFAAATMFAGEHGDCTKQVGNQAKMACTVSLASLNLTPEPSEGRLLGSQRGQIHGTGKINPDAGAIREVRIPMQERRQK